MHLCKFYMKIKYDSLLRKRVKIYSNIFHIWFSDYVDKLPGNRREAISPNGTVRKIMYIIKIFVKDLHSFFLRNNPPEDPVWLFVSTHNNCNSLRFLKDKLDKSEFVRPLILYKSQLSTSYRIVYRFKIFYDLLGIIYLPVYLRKAHNKYSYKYWTYFFKGYGLYEESKRILKKNRPEAIIFSNDHSIEHRALLLAANELGIKTIYLQHAAISHYFPPLQFDLSLLEGRDSLDKYLDIGEIKGKIELLGMPRFDNYVKYRSHYRKIGKIGICTNLNDVLEDVIQFINKLRERMNGEVGFVLRPHPSDDRAYDQLNIETSNSSVVESFEFLKNVDMIIAGDSSIHLEAAMLNKPAIYYKFKGNTMDDYYGFEKKGITYRAKSSADVENILRNPQKISSDLFLKCKYYNDAIGTAHEGHVQEKAIQIITDFISK